jgi:hypothetical protein
MNYDIHSVLHVQAPPNLIESIFLTGPDAGPRRCRARAAAGGRAAVRYSFIVVRSTFPGSVPGSFNVCEVAGLRAPVLPQSMYIFKSAAVGGPVTSHQDGTFLYTRPQQTVVGLWLALRYVRSLLTTVSILWLLRYLLYLP